MVYQRLLSLYQSVEPDSQLLFGPFYLYVEASGLTPSEAAADRVDRIWTLFNRHPKPANVPYCVGICIDSHWPAVESSCTLSELYRANRAPEQIADYVILADNRPVAEQLWRPAGPWCTPSTMPPKLLRKGLPDPPSDRYISGTFQKDLKAADPLAVSIIDCAILGAFQHATEIAPPPIRRQVYGNTIDRAALIDSLASRELYFLVSEHVIAITQGHPALLMAVSATCPGFDVYCREAITRVPRKKLWSLGKCPKTPRRCRAAPSARHKSVTTSAAAMLPAIVRALGIKLKTTSPPETHREAFDLGRETASACLHTATLEKLLTPEVAAKFCAELMGAARPVKKATNAVALLEPDKKALVAAFFRGRLAVEAGMAPTLRAFPTDECEVLVCSNCISLRSGSKGLGRLNSSGVNIDCLTGRIQCLDCGGDVMSVKLGAVVWRQLIKKPMLITMCDNCKLPTTVDESSVIGAGYLCKTCMATAPRVPDLCVCGELGNPKSLVRVASSRKTVLYAMCDFCARGGLPETALSLKSAQIYG